jgi:hypothetical protein
MSGDGGGGGGGSAVSGSEGLVARRNVHHLLLIRVPQEGLFEIQCDKRFQSPHQWGDIPRYWQECFAVEEEGDGALRRVLFRCQNDLYGVMLAL